MSKKFVLSKKGKSKSYTAGMDKKTWVGSNQRTTSKGLKVIDVKDTASPWNVSGIPREDFKELRSGDKKK